MSINIKLQFQSPFHVVCERVWCVVYGVWYMVCLAQSVPRFSHWPCGAEKSSSTLRAMTLKCHSCSHIGGPRFVQLLTRL